MPRTSSSRAVPERTAVFVDYQQLYTYAEAHYDGAQGAFDTTLAALADVRRYLTEGGRAQVTMASAYASFGRLHPNAVRLQEGLLERGYTPQYVRLLADTDATAALTVSACQALASADAPDTVVFVTATSALVPLVERVLACGRGAVVIHLGPIAHLDALPQYLRDCYLDLSDLARPGLRRRLDMPSASSKPAPATRLEAAPRPQTPRPPTHPVEGDLERRTLELIEENFGQYDEVYLTPLLRKLSEEIGDDGDPKEIISTLEEAGAVWLEKRRGFPHDYTVLLVNDEHEDVLDIRAALDEDADDDDDAYWDDDYVEDEYDEEEYVPDDVEGDEAERDVATPVSEPRYN